MEIFIFAWAVFISLTIGTGFGMLLKKASKSMMLFLIVATVATNLIVYFLAAEAMPVFFFIEMFLLGGVAIQMQPNQFEEQLKAES